MMLLFVEREKAIKEVKDVRYSSLRAVHIKLNPFPTLCLLQPIAPVVQKKPPFKTLETLMLDCLWVAGKKQAAVPGKHTHTE